jgi:hypothetical protein
MLKKLLFVATLTSLLGLAAVASADIPPPADAGDDATHQPEDAAANDAAASDAAAAGDGSPAGMGDGGGARDAAGDAARSDSGSTGGGGGGDDGSCRVSSGEGSFATLASAGLGLLIALTSRRRRSRS